MKIVLTVKVVRSMEIVIDFCFNQQGTLVTVSPSAVSAFDQDTLNAAVKYELTGNTLILIH